MSNPQPESDSLTIRSLVKVEDGLYAHYVVQKLSAAFVIVLIRLRVPVSPNQLTAFSLLLGIGAAVAFAMGQYSYLVLGVVLLNISFLLDCADGQLARIKGIQSQFGAWYDYHGDKIKDGLTLIGWTIGAYMASNQEQWWLFVVAFLGIFFQFLRNISALNRDIWMLQTTGNKDKSHSFIESSQNSSQFRRSLKNSMLFKLSDRILLYTVFGLLNLAMPAIIIYAAFTTLFAGLSGYLNYVYARRIDSEKAYS